MVIFFPLLKLMEHEERDWKVMAAEPVRHGAWRPGSFVHGCCMQETRGKGSYLGKLESVSLFHQGAYHLVWEVDKSPGPHGEGQRCKGDTAPGCRERK